MKDPTTAVRSIPGRRTVPWIAAILLAACARESPRPLNVLVLSVDALRPDHLGAYGYPRDTSPAIDALAARGVRFENAISQATWTLPSVTSLFLSQYVSTHGVEHPRHSKIPEAAETLAERMRDHGYRTSAFVMGAYTSREFGMDQGFETFVSNAGRAAKKNDALLRWIDGGEGRFFAYVHYVDVHHPYVEANPYRQSYGAGYQGPVNGKDKLGKWVPAMTPEGLQHLVDLYDDSVSFIDNHLGELFRALDERGLRDSTLLILTADHGEAFFEHEAMLGHRGKPYGELIRVPLIVAGPGIPNGRAVETLAEAVDLAPTILDACGIPPGPAMQGRSLMPLFHGGEVDKPLAYAESLPQGLAVVRDLEWKLMFESRAGRRRLFHLASDPGEQDDVAQQHPAVVERMTRRLAVFRRANEALAAPEPEDAEVADETLRQLRALGYIE